MEFPAMHSRIDGDTILEFPGANIGGRSRHGRRLGGCRW